MEKASYDDFYLNLDPTAAQRLTGNTKPQSIHVVGCGSAEELPRDLMDACCAASAIQHASSRLGLSTSVGVSRSKLLSRLLSPLHKPAAITALADAGMADFLHSQPIRRVPGLQGKLGRQVCEVLGAESVGDLRRFARVELVDKFGEATAAMLSDLANVRLSGTVRERVAPKTIICER